MISPRHNMVVPEKSIAAANPLFSAAIRAWAPRGSPCRIAITNSPEVPLHAYSIDDWRHEHVFLGADHARNERRSWAVVAVCGAMMAAEIIGGLLSGSMALIADGLHM